MPLAGNRLEKYRLDLAFLTTRKHVPFPCEGGTSRLGADRVL